MDPDKVETAAVDIETPGIDIVATPIRQNNRGGYRGITKLMLASAVLAAASLPIGMGDVEEIRVSDTPRPPPQRFAQQDPGDLVLPKYMRTRKKKRKQVPGRV